MIDGHLDDQCLQDLLDGALEDVVALGAWQHVSECRECRSRHASFILADRTLRASATAPSSGGRGMRRVAAAVLVAVGLTAASYFGRTSVQPDERRVPEREPVHVDVGFELTAIVETRTPKGRDLVSTHQSSHGVRTISRERLRGTTLDAHQHLLFSESFKGVER